MTTNLVQCYGYIHANFEWITVKLHVNMSRYVRLDMVEEHSGEAAHRRNAFSRATLFYNLKQKDEICLFTVDSGSLQWTALSEQSSTSKGFLEHLADRGICLFTGNSGGLRGMLFFKHHHHQ